VTDDELHEQLALYAVDALPDAERIELEDVLRTRPDLQAELVELEEAGAAIADAASEPPPAALRSRVLDLIAETEQLPADPAVDDVAVPPAVPITSHRRRNRFVAIGAAAAVVVGLLVGLLVASPWSGSQDPSAAVLTAADAQTIQMPGELPDVTIVHSPSRGSSVLQSPRVPVPQGDRVYELWAIRGGRPERAATFRPDADGSLKIYAKGLDPASAEQWAITEEPAGGSDQPTSAILNAT
jgi:anti-sigma-K factor RskA